ncbi:tetratricopeptide repeat protein [Bacillaceae bacterium W0354]
MKLIKEKLKWLDRIVYFDQNDFLREKANDHQVLKKIILELEDQFSQEINKDERYFLSGMLGNLYRVYEKPEKAIDYLNISYQLAKEENIMSKKIVTLIRMGEAYKYKGEHVKALSLFNNALQKSYDYEPSYLDFAYQHKGKCLMELGHLEEAMEVFQGALAIRKAKGDEQLIQSTNEAINYVKMLKENMV